MPSVNVTLTSYDKREGQGQRGPWTLHLFKDSAGQSYQTFEAPISNRAYGLLNQPVVLEYKDKPSKNPEYPPNKEIVDIQPDTSVVRTDDPGLPPTTTSEAPTTTGRAAFAANSGDDRQIQIMRQSALERAIRALSAQIDGFDEQYSVYELSEQFLHYFQTGEYPGKSEKDVIAGFEALAAE